MPFVSFEGIDGSGKTAQLRRTADWLAGQGIDAVRTKEPDGGRIGAPIRAILVGGLGACLSPIEELLLVSAARFDHVRAVIRPALAAGRWILSDRFIDSTYALQVHETGVPQALFAAVTDAVTGCTIPDLTIILNLSPEQATARRLARDGHTGDPAELVRNFGRIGAGFRAVAAREPGRCRLIDASGSEAAVFEKVREAVVSLGTPSAPQRRSISS